MRGGAAPPTNRRRRRGWPWSSPPSGSALISLRGFSIGSGEAITLLCALAFGLHIVGLGEWSSTYDAAGLAVVQLTTVAVLSIVIAAPSSLAPPPDAGVWGAILLTAIAATALAFFIQTWAQARLAPTRAAVVMTMEPVFAGIFGVPIGGDSLSARIIVGAACSCWPRCTWSSSGLATARMRRSSDSSSIICVTRWFFSYYAGSGQLLGRVE